MQCGEDLWLGRLKKPVGRFNTQLGFSPVARFNGVHWETVAETDRRGRNAALIYGDGTVTTGQHVDTSWLFRRTAATDGRIAATAESPQRADSLLNFSNMSMAKARHLLCDRGVTLPEGNGNTAVVLLEDGFCARLKFGKVGSTWKVKLPADGVVELLRAKPSWGAVDPDGRFPFLPEPLDAEVVRTTCWLTDADVLSQAFEGFSAAVSAYQSMLAGSEQPYKRLQRALRDGRLAGDDAIDFQAIVDRMRAEWPTAARAMLGLRELSDLLLKSDEARAMLAMAVEQRAAEAAEEIESRVRAEMDLRLASTREELQSLERRITEKRASEAALDGRVHALRGEQDLLAKNTRTLHAEMATSTDLIRSAREETERLKGEVQAAQEAYASVRHGHDEIVAASNAVEQRLTDFVQEARRAFGAVGTSDVAATAILAERLRDWLAGVGKDVPSFVPSSTPPWALPTAIQAGKIELSNLQERLTQESENYGIQLQDLSLLDVLVRAGEPVLVAGSMAESALQAYARAVSGGQVRVHALDPSTIGLDDVWRMAATGRPTAFALAWHRAATFPEETVLVCLRDLDAAPFRLWLASLMSALSSQERPSNLLIVATTSCISSETRQVRSGGSDPARALAVVVPRPSQSAASCNVVLGAALAGESTRLVAGVYPSDPSPRVARELCGLEVHPPSIGRALRIAGIACGSAGGPSVQSIAGWARFWAGAEPDATQPSLCEAARTIAGLRDMN